MKKLRSRGAALTDYGLIVGLIAVGAIGAVVTTGDEVASIYCKATNGMMEITGGDPQSWCIDDPNARVTLSEDERFVDIPVAMQADFTDMLFANLETGERLVMSSVKDAPAGGFSFQAGLTSRDPHESDRQISACYLLGGGVDPICAAPGATSTIMVPGSAEAFGYSVTLSADTDMPWANDVALSIPGPEGAEPQVWNIDVSREEAEPVLDSFAVAFSDHTYQQTDSGWTYGAFAPIEGKFNRTIRLSMENVSGTTRNRKACYIPSADADPICSPAYSQANTVVLDVAPGAVALGYEIELPTPRTGPDWVVSERFNVFQDAALLHSQAVTITRPNEPYAPGSVATTYASPYSFAQTDTGWTEGEFIALSGPRNVTLDYWIYKDGSGHGYYRKACYKTVSGGEPLCGNPQTGYYTANHEIPPEAVEVGYMVQLPAESVGPATSRTDLHRLQHGGDLLIDKRVTWERPNEPYASGSVATTFVSPYSFAQTDTGWTEGEFIAISGERNVSLDYWIYKDGSGHGYNRKACYKTVSGGEPLCGAPQSGYYTANHKIPPEAVEVGYMVQLPAESVGPATSRTDLHRLQHGGTLLINTKVTWERPNEPYAIGSIPTAYSTPYSFAQTDTGWTEGEFIALAGDRNVNLDYYIYADSNYGYYRKACYKTAAGGSPDCGTPQTGRSSVSHVVPPEAVEVGYMVQLPNEGVGPATAGTDRHYIRHGSSVLVNKYVTWERPNEPYAIGSMPAAMSTNFSFAQTDTSWTEGEFVAISGDRNVDLDYYIYAKSDYPYSRMACYKTVAGGVPDCGASQTGRSSAFHRIPPEAVEVGYMVSLPNEAIGPATVGTDRHYIRHGSTALMNKEITWERPNEPYQRGAMAKTFTDHTFAASDQGWTEGEFIALSGPRNVNLDYYIYNDSNYGYYRKACYKTAAGGVPNCGNQQLGHSWAQHSIPPEAVEVGYMVQLPADASLRTGSDRHQVRHGTYTLTHDTITWTRPAP